MASSTAHREDPQGWVEQALGWRFWQQAECGLCAQRGTHPSNAINSNIKVLYEKLKILVIQDLSSGVQLCLILKLILKYH